TAAITVDPTVKVQVYAQTEIEAALETLTGSRGLSAAIRIEVGGDVSGAELAIMMVNMSPAEHATLRDTRLYECSLSVSGLSTIPYLLEALPDSFRYDRRVSAYGINCGVDSDDSESFRTTDTIGVSRPRPRFWPAGQPEPDLSFTALATDP